MKQSEKTIYSCDFCNKKMFVKGAMLRHEEWCYKNPKNTPKCESCKFLEEIEVEYYFDTYHGESSRVVKGFKCAKRDIELYPLKAERLGLPGKYPETFFEKELMPNECELFNNGFTF